MKNSQFFFIVVVVNLLMISFYFMFNIVNFNYCYYLLSCCYYYLDSISYYLNHHFFSITHISAITFPICWHEFHLHFSAALSINSFQIISFYKIIKVVDFHF